MRNFDTRALRRSSAGASPAIMQLGTTDSHQASCEYDFVDNAEGTVFAFGGIRQKMGMATREFQTALSGRKYNLVFIKDFNRAWYQKGLLGLTQSRKETVRFLLSHFDQLPRPWITVGLSAGGYASLFFGSRMGADRVVSFSPQTFITTETYERFKVLPDTGQDHGLDTPENDLALALSDNTVDLFVHYPLRNSYDRAQSEHIKRLPRIHLLPNDSKDHNIALELRKQGLLNQAVFGSLGERPIP